MSFKYLINWLIKKKKCKDIHQHNKNMSKKKMKEYIECLPKQELIERIYGWLENEENETEIFSYIEDEDDNRGDVNYLHIENHLDTSFVKLRDIHQKEILGKYLHGSFMKKFDRRKQKNIEALTNISMMNNKNIVNRT